MTYADAYTLGYEHSADGPNDNPFTFAELVKAYNDGYCDGVYERLTHEPARHRRWVANGDSYGPFTA